MLDFTGKSDFTVAGRFVISGGAPNYTGYASTIADSGEMAVKLYSADRYDISGIRATNINGTAFDAQAFAGAYQHVGHVHHCSVTDSYRGFWWHNVAEYDTLSHLQASNCVFGYIIDAGNIGLDFCKATNNTIALSVLGGTNNAHGLVTGFMAHHNAFPLVCTNVTLGMAFVDCSFIAGLDSYAGGIGTIQMNNSKGITLTGGQLASVNIAVDATSELSLDGVTLRGPVNVTVAAGGIFTSVAPRVMPGAALTLNGVAWNGVA